METEASPSPAKVAAAAGTAVFAEVLQQAKGRVAGSGKVLGRLVLQLLKASNQTEHGQAAVVQAGIW